MHITDKVVEANKELAREFYRVYFQEPGEEDSFEEDYVQGHLCDVNNYMPGNLDLPYLGGYYITMDQMRVALKHEVPKDVFFKWREEIYEPSIYSSCPSAKNKFVNLRHYAMSERKV